MQYVGYLPQCNYHINNLQTIQLMLRAGVGLVHNYIGPAVLTPLIASVCFVCACRITLQQVVRTGGSWQCVYMLSQQRIQVCTYVGESVGHTQGMGSAIEKSLCLHLLCVGAFPRIS